MSNIYIAVADIASLNVDAIVCSAHKTFLPNRGIMAHVAENAGDKFVEQCRTLEKGKVGDTKIVGAYDLSSKYVICTVTPLWSSGDQYGAECMSQLQTCYERSISIALKYGVKNIAFSALGAGTHHVPQHIVSRQCMDTIANYGSQFETVTVCLGDQSAMDVWETEYFRHYEALPSTQFPEQLRH